MTSAFRNTYWYPSHPFHLFSLASAFMSEDPWVTQTWGLFSAGWCGCPCTHVPNVTGRASSSVTGLEVAPTDYTDGAHQTPAPLMVLSALVSSEWSCKAQRNIFFSFKPFAFSKAVINCQAEQSMEHKGIVSKLICFYYEHSCFSWP